MAFFFGRPAARALGQAAAHVVAEIAFLPVRFAIMYGVIQWMQGR